MLDLNAMLDQSMEVVEAAPNYVIPENGHYVILVSDTGSEVVKAKEAGKEDYARLKHVYQIEAVIEQEGLPIAPGSLFSDSWMLSEQGLPYFKARTLDIAEANGEDRTEIGGLKLGEMLGGVKGMRFQCIIQKTPRSDDPTRYNIRISNIRAAD